MAESLFVKANEVVEVLRVSRTEAYSIEYLDYYNNQRIKVKLKGLPPAIHRQQALSAA